MSLTTLTIKINLCTSDNNPIKTIQTITDLDPNITTGTALRNIVAKKLDIPVGQVILIFNGQKIKDSETLAKAGVAANNANIFLLTQQQTQTQTTTTDSPNTNPQNEVIKKNIKFKFKNQTYPLSIDYGISVTELIQQIKGIIGNNFNIEVHYNGKKLQDGDGQIIPTNALLYVEEVQINQSVQNQNNANGQQTNDLLISGYNNNITTSYTKSLINNKASLNTNNYINSNNTQQTGVNFKEKSYTFPNININPTQQNNNTIKPASTNALRKYLSPNNNNIFPNPIQTKNPIYPRTCRQIILNPPKQPKSTPKVSGYIPLTSYNAMNTLRPNTLFSPIIRPKPIATTTLPPLNKNQVILSSPNIINTNKPTFSIKNTSVIPPRVVPVRNYYDNNTHFVRNVPIYEAVNKKGLTNMQVPVKPMPVPVQQVQTVQVPTQVPQNTTTIFGDQTTGYRFNLPILTPAKTYNSVPGKTTRAPVLIRQIPKTVINNMPKYGALQPVLLTRTNQTTANPVKPFVPIVNKFVKPVPVPVTAPVIATPGGISYSNVTVLATNLFDSRIKGGQVVQKPDTANALYKLNGKQIFARGDGCGGFMYSDKPIYDGYGGGLITTGAAKYYYGQNNPNVYNNPNVPFL